MIFVLNNSEFHLLKTKFESDYQISTTKISHYYIVAGGNIDISDEFQLNSQLLTRIVSGAPISYLFSTRMFFKDKISLGIHFEPNNILGVFTSVEVVEGLGFGFGYDYSINELSNYSNGNYSITMSYTFKAKDNYSWKLKEQVKSPYVVK